MEPIISEFLNLKYKHRTNTFLLLQTFFYLFIVSVSRIDPVSLRVPASLLAKKRCMCGFISDFLSICIMNIVVVTWTKI